MVLTRDSISSHADAVLAVLDSTEGLNRGALARDPVRALQDWWGVDVSVHDSAPGDSEQGCEVAGAYTTVGDRPTLVVTAASPARMAFTVLHELAHHLQRNDKSLAKLLLEFGSDDEALEEAVCDEVAARLLIPTGVIGAHLGAGLTAAAIVSLWTDTSASRAAVCVAAARLLPAPGHVTLMDESGIVQFDAARGLPRVGRRSDQSRSPVVALALANQRGSATAEGRFVYRDGIRGDKLYMQAANIGGYIVVVSVMDKAPWRKFSVSLTDAEIGRAHV